MIMLKSLIGFGLITAASAKYPENPGCGDINVLYTGLPAYHPYVVEQGWDPSMVDASIRSDTQNLINAGYNTRIVLMGPEEDISQMEARFKDVEFHVTGIGYGMRPSKIPEVITRFEDNVFLFNRLVPDTPTVYNYNPNTFLWSVERRFPIKEDCSKKPGKDLGYVEICDDRCELTKTSWNLRKAALNKDKDGALFNQAVEMNQLFGKV
ncbi:unnamed protein product [Clonostachys solani]|uniref:Uncharacterized protein n=1 Tax=Clonostachys solani TaxID=160281 RepID=A0A9N9W299_9HYPO|nr:unnamed protein product [Clonostachys solani]